MAEVGASETTNLDSTTTSTEGLGEAYFSVLSG